MNQTAAQPRKQLPSHWVGVYKNWRNYSDNPLDSLVTITPYQMRTHGLMIGSTGSGKTTAIHHLIAQDIKEGNSFCVLDKRGDLVGAALELCAGRVDPARLCLFDLRDKERSPGFNPLSGEGEPYIRALNVLDTIGKNSESWGVRLAETLRCALMLLAELRRPLTELEPLLYNEEYRRYFLPKCQNELLTAYWNRYNALSPSEQNTLAAPVMNKVSLLFATKTLRQILGHPTPIDLGQHLDTPGSILLVSLAYDEMHEAGMMMGNLFLGALSREIFARVSIPEYRRNPVRLYVDEFEHFGTSEFENLLAEGRKYRLSLILAHQTLAQLSPRMRSMILNNVGVKAYFRCGRDDAIALNRDLTGAPDTYPLTELPVGTMVLWRREYPIFEVEVNEPLIHGDVGQSPRARAFRDAVYELYRPPVVAEVVREEAKPLVIPAGSLGSRQGSFLSEEWL